MPALLEEAAAGQGRQVYLFEGDEYLARHSARELAEALVPEKDRALNLVLMDASAGTWKNHGQYVSCVTHVAQTCVADGLATAAERAGFVQAAAHSSVGK